MSFIEVGHRTKSGGEANAGCAQVQRIVNDLCDNGNESVFGLVDWDGNVSESERIKVLSPTIRNGLESALFDPVLLFASCVRNNIRFMREKGIVNDEESYVGLKAWDKERWQLAVNELQALVLGEKSILDENNFSIVYLNGMNLQISRDYLHFDDHKLEERVVTVFGFLKPHNNHAGGLMRHIIETTLTDMPSLLPMDVIHTYKRILGE